MVEREEHADFTVQEAVIRPLRVLRAANGQWTTEAQVVLRTKLPDGRLVITEGAVMLKATHYAGHKRRGASAARGVGGNDGR